MEVGSRRILYTNVMASATAEWTIQQDREFIPFDHTYQFVITTTTPSSQLASVSP